jgi:hypothetical protein
VLGCSNFVLYFISAGFCQGQSGGAALLIKIGVADEKGLDKQILVWKKVSHYYQHYIVRFFL